jgi:hypothetical protein
VNTAVLTLSMLLLFVQAAPPAAKAQAVVQQLTAGQFPAIEAQFTDKMKAARPEDQLARKG